MAARDLQKDEGMRGTERSMLRSRFLSDREEAAKVWSFKCFSCLAGGWVPKHIFKWIGEISAPFFLSNFWKLFYHVPSIVLIRSISCNFPPCGRYVISSAMISLRARFRIDLTHWSIGHEVTDHHPIVKRPDEVIDLVSLDLDLLTSGSGPAGVCRRDASLINSSGSM